jgi:alpha-methylacyl-CoA racemase
MTDASTPRPAPGKPSGPLRGYRILELAGLGALPYATLKLADMGADVIRVNRVSDAPADPPAASEISPQQHWREFDRGRRSIAVDLKQLAGVELVLRLAEQSDVLVEAFRPGVAERLGLGPEQVMGRNPKLVYGRLTGWGQTGPLAQAAGHSLNYESLAGAIGSIGPVGGPPVPLLQVLGDFAGGGLHLAYGVVCALLEAGRSGQGQVVDAAMLDGVMSLYSVFYTMAASGMHTEAIGTNLFDGGAPFYNVYETSDGRYVSVAPIEPHFYRRLLDALEIPADDMPAQYDQSQWPVVRERLAAVFRTRTRDEWQQQLEGSDVCFAPVMRLGEAHEHPHNVARGAFVTTPDGGRQLRPAPRLSGMSVSGDEVNRSYAYVGADTDVVLGEFGLDPGWVADLHAAGVVA